MHYRNIFFGLLCLFTITHIYGELLHTTCETCALAKRSSPNVTFVDVFVVANETHGASFDGINQGNFWATLEVIKKYSRLVYIEGDPRPHYDTRIHIFTETERILTHGRSLGSPFFVHDMRKYEGRMLEFQKIYYKTHRSVNHVDYEFMCFNRWHQFRYVLEAWNKRHPPPSQMAMTRILSLDLDVLMTMNVVDFVNRLEGALMAEQQSSPSSSSAVLPAVIIADEKENEQRQQQDFKVIVVGLGAINLLSDRGIVAFSEYIYDWYNKTEEEVVKTNDRWLRYFSDMMIMKQFVEDALDSSEINACFEYWKADAYYSQWRTKASNMCLLERLGCVPMSGYREMMDGNSLHYFIRNISVVASPIEETLHPLSAETDMAGQSVAIKGNREKTLPYCLIHFQGAESKIWLYFYTLLTNEILRRGQKANSELLGEKSPTIDKPMLLVTGAGRRNIDLLVLSSIHGLQRRHIINMDEFHEWNKMVRYLYNIPGHLLDYLEDGPEITVSMRETTFLHCSHNLNNCGIEE